MQKNTKLAHKNTRILNTEEQRYLRRVGLSISTARHNMGLTQYALAKQLGISRNTLMLIETAQMNTSLLMVRKIANALGVSISKLIDHSDVN